MSEHNRRLIDPFYALRESNPFYNSYCGYRPILITSSEIRHEFAKLFGRRVIKSPNLPVDSEHKTQKKASEEIGLKSHGYLPIRRGSFSPELPLELAIDKARGVLTYMQTEKGNGFNKDRESYITVDSVYKITFPNGKEFILQKPNTQQDINNILELLRTGMEVGARISNLTGICRVDFLEDPVNKKNPPPVEYSAWILEIDFGQLNRDFQILDELEKRMKENGHFSSGFSSTDIFSGIFPLISLEDQFKIKVRNYLDKSNNHKISPYILERGGLGGKDFELSNDATNYEKIIAFSLGIFPQ